MLCQLIFMTFWWTNKKSEKNWSYSVWKNVSLNSKYNTNQLKNAFSFSTSNAQKSDFRHYFSRYWAISLICYAINIVYQLIYSTFYDINWDRLLSWIMQTKQKKVFQSCRPSSYKLAIQLQSFFLNIWINLNFSILLTNELFFYFALPVVDEKIFLKRWFSAVLFPLQNFEFNITYQLIYFLIFNQLKSGTSWYIRIELRRKTPIKV